MKKGTDNNNKKYMWPAAIALAGTLLSACPASGATPSDAGTQNRLTVPTRQGWLSRGRLMHSDGDLQGAADQLRMAISTLPAGERRREAQVSLMRTLLLLRDPECMALAQSLRDEEGTSPTGVEAQLTMGDWYFFGGEYGPACMAYAAVPDLSTRPLYAYRAGVSQLRTGAFDKGRRLLRPLAASDSEYRAPADFYLAWADYAQGSLDEALRAFKAVQPRLAKVNRDSRGDRDQYLPASLEAGYYIAQIEFQKENYRSAAEQCRSLLIQAPDAVYTAELNRLAGESLFKLGELKEAEPYLQAYMSQLGTDTPAPTAAYALGAIAYADGRDALARRMLDPLMDAQGVPMQGAALLLGQMAAADKDWSAAALYFDKSWRAGTERALSERALYNLITAVAQGADMPFASATQLPEQFLQLFPGSKYEPQVREYLSAAYFRDKDYGRALASLERIPHLTERQKTARQTVLYELGVSELSNGDYASAAQHLAAAAGGSDRRIGAQAQVWLGQALYAQGKFAQAEQAFNAYLRLEPQGANAGQARYDAAYALYMQDKFGEAAREFERALSTASLPSRLRTDAKMRLADCYYYQRDYTQAGRLYAEAEQSGDGDAAYAALRAAMMEGLRGDYASEIRGLRAMTSRYPESQWTPAALYELATALAKSGDTQQALTTYAEVASRYPQLEEGRRAQLQVATLYAAAGDSDQAIAAYQDVIRRWPTGEEAKAANVELRRLMAERGELTAYAAFMNSVPGAPKIDNAELEHLAFDAADTRLIASSADRQPMLDYLTAYPDGLYVAAGLWRLAQACDDGGDYEGALKYIGELESRRPDAAQLPEALILKGVILEEHYPSRGAEALASFRRAEQLLGANTPPELYAGLMRMGETPAEQLKYAGKLRAMGSLSSEESQEADYYEAGALAATGSTEAAIRLYKGLAAQPSSLYGARGAVALGELLVSLKRYKEAEKVLSDFTNASTPHAYWLARGYIALADAVASSGRKALAREYLNALKANYPGNEADIRRMIENGLKNYK